MQNRTINVSVIPQVIITENGSEVLELLIQRNASSVASTSNGRYYIRVDDDCKPVPPDELPRLLEDKGAFVWETHTFLRVSRNDYNEQKLEQLYIDVQNSERISNFVKQKSPQELLEHYFMVSGQYLTNLGILWIGEKRTPCKIIICTLYSVL